VGFTVDLVAGIKALRLRKSV